MNEMSLAAGSLPLPRYLYSFDSYQVKNESSLDTKFVIFGGETKSKCYLNDLWGYSVSTNQWERESRLQAEQNEACKTLQGS